MRRDLALQNQRTRVAGTRDRFLPIATADTPLSAELFAGLERDRARRSEEACVAVIVTWRQGGEAHHVQSSLFVVKDDVPTAVSLGRHTSCDFGGIPGAALRHAILLVQQGQSAPLVEAIDLRTGIGLFVGEPHLADRIEGTGAVRFGVGAAEVIVLTSAPGTPLLPKALGDSLFSHTSCGGRRIRPQPEDERRFFGAVVEESVVWAQRPSEISRAEIVDAFQTRPTSFFRSPRRAAFDPVAGEAVVVTINADDIVEGVLLGRYPRCRGAEELSQNASVSRVHALVVERGGQTWLVDAGSTFGTVVRRGHRVTARLPAMGRVFRLDEGDQLFLGDCEVRLVVDGIDPNVPGGCA